MSQTRGQIVDREAFGQIRGELGDNLARIIGYFREDGVKSIAAIEQAMRDRNAAALVRPAHTLKGESLQFGAEPLGYMAEAIEKAARAAVEAHSFPLEVSEDVAELRPLFAETLAFFDRELGLPPTAIEELVPPPAAPARVASAPLAMPSINVAPRRPGGFGRKVTAA